MKLSPYRCMWPVVLLCAVVHGGPVVVSRGIYGDIGDADSGVHVLWGWAAEQTAPPWVSWSRSPVDTTGTVVFVSEGSNFATYLGEIGDWDSFYFYPTFTSADYLSDMDGKHAREVVTQEGLICEVRDVGGITSILEGPAQAIYLYDEGQSIGTISDVDGRNQFRYLHLAALGDTACVTFAARLNTGGSMLVVYKQMLVRSSGGWSLSGTPVAVAGGEQAWHYGAFHPSASADGDIVAFQFVDPSDGANDIYISVAGLADPLVYVGEGIRPVISADGSRLFYEVDGGVVMAQAGVWSDPASIVIAPVGARAPTGRFPQCSADGRHVVFTSVDHLLVDVDGGGAELLYVVETETGGIRCLSVDDSGNVVDASVRNPTISPDGRYVTYASNDERLTGQATGVYQVLLHDLGELFSANHPPASAELELACEVNQAESAFFCDVSLSAKDADGDSIEYHLISGPANGTVMDSGGNPVSGWFTASISPLRFTPNAGFAGSDSFMFQMRDIRPDAPETSLYSLPTRVSVIVGGELSCLTTDIDRDAPKFPDLDRVGMSGDGRLVAFGISAENQLGKYEVVVYDRETGQHRVVFEYEGTYHYSLLTPRCSISEDGSAVVFSVSPGGIYWIPLTDGVPGTALTAASGTGGKRVGVSGDGGTVVYHSGSPKNVYVWEPGVVDPISVAVGSEPVISGNGNVIAFIDANGHIALIGRGADGEISGSIPLVLDGLGTGNAELSLSFSGRLLAFESASGVQVVEPFSGPVIVAELSDASRPFLVPSGRYLYMVQEDEGGTDQAYLHDLSDGDSVLLSHTVDGEAGSAVSYQGAVSTRGDVVCFGSDAELLGEGSERDVFVTYFGSFGDDQAPVGSAMTLAVNEDLEYPGEAETDGLPLAIDLSSRVSDGNGYDLDFSFDIVVGGEPTHGVFKYADALGLPTFVYTPAEHFHGTENVTFSVRDASGLTGNITVGIEVIAVDDPPAFRAVAAEELEILEDESFVLAALVTEVDDDAFTVGSSGEENLVCTKTGENVWTVSSTNKNWNGTESITFTATDETTAALEGKTLLTFTVLPVDDSPVLGEIAPQTIVEDGAFEVVDLGVVLTEVDGDSVVWSWEFVAEGRGTPTGNLSVEIDQAGQTATVTPDPDWNGSRTVRFKVTDVETKDAVPTENGYSAFADVLFSVTAQDDDPAITPFTVPAIDEGSSFATIDLASRLVEVDGDAVAYSALVLPTRGSPGGSLSVAVSVAGIATVSIPNENWNGSQTVRFVVTDQTSGAKSGRLDVAFTVNAVDDAPVLASIPDQEIGETSVFAEIDLDEFLTEYDGDVVIWTWAGNADLLVSTNPATGTIVVTAPDAEWLGQETLTFTVTDHETDKHLAGSATATFSRKHYTVVALEEGWNLVCFPIALSEASWQKFMGVVDGPGWAWNVPVYTLIDANSSPPAAGVGAWFHCVAAGQVSPMELLGDLPSGGEIPFAEGWNLVGPVGAGDLSLVPSTDTSGGAFLPLAMWGWQDGFYEPVLDGILQRNRAYWIRCEATPASPVNLELDVFE